MLKPAPSTPLTTLMLGPLIKEASIPDGVVNMGTGGIYTGQAMVAHPDVRMVSLTGSTNTSKKIMKSAADTLKRVHLELGGKAPFIVFDDVDPELIATKATLAATINRSGLHCGHAHLPRQEKVEGRHRSHCRGDAGRKDRPAVR